MNDFKEPKFIVDLNAGKLAKWLRIMGYDASLFTDRDDGKMIKIALAENRIILTKDTHIMERRVVTSGKVKTILIEGDNPKRQLEQVTTALQLDFHFKPFSLCLECNLNLVERNKSEVSNLVPEHVFKTQTSYKECPSCHRIFWKGTHWQAMCNELGSFVTRKEQTSKVARHS
jgi:uncharacterized protein with PIN domain